MKPFRIEFEKKIFQIFKQCQKSSECFNTLIIQYYYGDSKHNSLETAHGGHKVLEKKIKKFACKRSIEMLSVFFSYFHCFSKKIWITHSLRGGFGHT